MQAARFCHCRGCDAISVTHFLAQLRCSAAAAAARCCCLLLLFPAHLQQAGRKSGVERLEVEAELIEDGAQHSLCVMMSLWLSGVCVRGGGGGKRWKTREMRGDHTEGGQRERDRKARSCGPRSLLPTVDVQSTSASSITKHTHTHVPCCLLGSMPHPCCMPQTKAKKFNAPHLSAGTARSALLKRRSAATEAPASRLAWRGGQGRTDRCAETFR